MRAIQFYRTKDDSVCGSMSMSAGGQIEAEGIAKSVLATAERRGDNPQQIFDTYKSWANQAVYSKEERSVSKKFTSPGVIRAKARRNGAKKLGQHINRHPQYKDDQPQYHANGAPVQKSLSDLVEKIEYPATTAPLDRSPRKNWVENAGGLPMYIRRIANHLNSDKGMDISHAIAVAVNVAKKMCATGDTNWPGVQQVNAGSHAEACAAVSEWEAKKAGSHVSKVRVAKGLRVMPTDEEVGEYLIGIGEATPIDKRFFSAGARKKAAKSGAAMPDGSFPIKNAKDLENAKRLVGRAKDPEAARAHINARAKALGLQGLSKREEVEFEVQGEISKADAPRGLVFGWAQIATRADGTTLVDKQGDFIDDPSELEDAAYDFVLNSRDGGEMHVRKGVSRLVESFMGTEEKYKAMGIPEGTLPIGWWTGWKIDDPEVIAKVKNGHYPMFSVHGRGIRKAVEE